MTPDDLARDVHALFSGPLGARVWTALCARWRDRASYVPGDPVETAYREGQRSVFLALTPFVEHTHARDDDHTDPDPTRIS